MMLQQLQTIGEGQRVAIVDYNKDDVDDDDDVDHLWIEIGDHLHSLLQFGLLHYCCFETEATNFCKR